ncbi:MAG: cupin domain-containing protein [Pseudomonadota bacterium]
MPVAPMTAADPDRVLPQSPHWSLPAGDAKVSRIDAIEGVPMGAPVELHELIVTPTMSMVKVKWAKGSASSPHVHLDHDSVVYVIRGRLRVTAEGETIEAGPGDSLTSPPGVEHAIEALEESESIEVKTPPVRTW